VLWEILCSSQIRERITNKPSSRINDDDGIKNGFSDSLDDELLACCDLPWAAMCNEDHGHHILLVDRQKVPGISTKSSRMTALLIAFSLLLGSSLHGAAAFTPMATSKLSASFSNHMTNTENSESVTKLLDGDAAEANEDGEEPTVYYSILSESDPEPPMAAQRAVATTTSYPTLNGWYPKEDYALWGLPGAIAPTGFFDPLGFARRGLPLNDAKRLREAEVQHGRVAMLAVVGYLAGEAVPQSPLGIVGPANDQLQQMPAPAFALLTAAIAGAELYRAKRGWLEPTFRIGSGTLWTLRDSYYPGDLGFDPLGLKPTENYAFQRIQTAELSNGRLAMIGWAGMCAQEIVNHRTIGGTLEFYRILFSGGNPYEGYY
jgi:hypothetical protein